MERRIITTADGSKTIYLKDWDEYYHSKHGAIQEAYHVFIRHGLHFIEQQEIAILEIGFGTGLNALITLHEASTRNLRINYSGIEAFPLEPQELTHLNYVQELQIPDLEKQFIKMHTVPWNQEEKITSYFNLHKQKKDFREINDKTRYDLIYFDAFGARVQPELWTNSIFDKMYSALKNKGVLVTYSAKGSVRRAMLAAGFEVDRLPGPPGKREMLRAIKK